MKKEKIEEYILGNYSDVNPINTWGEQSFFINPQMRFKRGTYFSTIKSKDGENDGASNLDREGVYRLNIGVSKGAYMSFFGDTPKRPKAGGIVECQFDFTELDLIMPHPVYAWINWVCVLNPSEETFASCIPLLDDAYKKASLLTAKKLQKLVK